MSNIIGIGVDIISVERMARAWQLRPRLAQRILAPQEISEMQERQGYDPLHLAGRWAAKEAVSKALGSGMRGFSFPDIVVYHNEWGNPLVQLLGGAAIRGNQLGVSQILLSLSHESAFAIAYAVALGSTNI
ncbi:MAG: holo-ACP synthase [Symbiobacteriaceae bacterium]|nr:holo-ACP synthase [Symbiobacteriaceae bacterium]